jgi:ribosomal protein L15
MYAEGGGDGDAGRSDRSGQTDRSSSRSAEPSRESQYPRQDRAPRRDFSRPTPVSRDPFFDRPYEAVAVSEAAPAWEATVKQASRGMSANIKPKRRVAALFKAEPA